MTGLKFFVAYCYDMEFDAPLSDAGGIARGTVRSRKTVFENREMICAPPMGIDDMNALAEKISEEIGLSGPVTIVYLFPFPKIQPEMPRILRPGSVN
jgi:hypothetical protein